MRESVFKNAKAIAKKTVIGGVAATVFVALATLGGCIANVKVASDLNSLHAYGTTDSVLSSPFSSKEDISKAMRIIKAGGALSKEDTLKEYQKLQGSDVLLKAVNAYADTFYRALEKTGAVEATGKTSAQMYAELLESNMKDNVDVSATSSVVKRKM